MIFITYFTFLLATSIFFALAEIQIEGKNGWAANLPTWKVYPSRQNRFFSMLLHQNRPLTGYHIYMFSFVFLLIHSFFVFTPWSTTRELDILIFFLALVSLEDFLWFILNPNFGLKKFSAQYIPWHPQWIGPLPSSYYLSLIIIALLVYIRTQLG